MIKTLWSIPKVNKNYPSEKIDLKILSKYPKYLNGNLAWRQSSHRNSTYKIMEISLHFRKATTQMSVTNFSCLLNIFLQLYFFYFFKKFHSLKSVRIRDYYGLDFLAFGLNTERYFVSPRIQSKCGKMRSRITPNTDTFYAVFSIHIVRWLPFFIINIKIIWRYQLEA